MGEHPTPAIREAIESAVSWFGANNPNGIQWDRKIGENTVLHESSAAPNWARYYQIETKKPIFRRIQY